MSKASAKNITKRTSHRRKPKKAKPVARKGDDAYCPQIARVLDTVSRATEAKLIPELITAAALAVAEDFAWPVDDRTASQRLANSLGVLFAASGFMLGAHPKLALAILPPRPEPRERGLVMPVIDVDQRKLHRTHAMAAALAGAFSNAPIPASRRGGIIPERAEIPQDTLDQIWEETSPLTLHAIAEMCMRGIRSHQKDKTLGTPEGGQALVNGATIAFLALGRLLASLREVQEHRKIWCSTS